MPKSPSPAKIFQHDGKPFPRLDGSQAEIEIPDPSPAGFIVGGVTFGENEPAPDPSTNPRVFVRRHPGEPPEYAEQYIGANKVVIAGEAKCSSCGKTVAQSRGGKLWLPRLSERGRVEAGVARYCAACYPGAHAEPGKS